MDWYIAVGEVVSRHLFIQLLIGLPWNMIDGC